MEDFIGIAKSNGEAELGAIGLPGYYLVLEEDKPGSKLANPWSWRCLDGWHMLGAGLSDPAAAIRAAAAHATGAVSPCVRSVDRIPVPPVARIAEDVADIRAQLRELAASLPTRISIGGGVTFEGSPDPAAIKAALSRKLPSVLADQSEEITHLRRRLVESEGFKARAELEDLAHDLGIRGSGKLSDADLLAEIRCSITKIRTLAGNRNRQVEDIALVVGVKEFVDRDVGSLLGEISDRARDMLADASKVRSMAIERDSAIAGYKDRQRHLDEIFGLLLSVSSVEARGSEAAGLRSLIERCHGLQKIADGATADLAKMQADRDALAEANARGSAAFARMKVDRDGVVVERDVARRQRDEAEQTIERLDNANARLRSDLTLAISARDAAQARLAEREELERKAFFGDLHARELERDLTTWRAWAMNRIGCGGGDFKPDNADLMQRLDALWAKERADLDALAAERATLANQLAAVTSAPMAVALRDTIEGLRAIGAVLGDDIRGESGLEVGQRLAARVRTLDSVWAGILGTFGLDPKADPRGVVELVRSTARERERFQAALGTLGMTDADSERAVEWARAQVSRRGACQSISRRELERTFVAAGGVSPADPSSEKMADHIIARLVELKEANDKLARWDRDAAADVLSSVRRVLGCGDGDDVVAIAGARCRRISDQYNRISDLEAALSWWRNDFASRFVPGTVLPLEGSHVATLRFQAL